MVLWMRPSRGGQSNIRRAQLWGEAASYPVRVAMWARGKEGGGSWGHTGSLLGTSWRSRLGVFLSSSIQSIMHVSAS